MPKTSNIMKKTINQIKLIFAFIAMAFTFSSCEMDDNHIAYTLEGTWKGDMYQEYEWNGDVYNPTSTEVCFLRNPYKYSSGEGYWVDYFNWGYRHNYIANHMQWKVFNGTIRIYLIEDDVEFTIRDYRLSDNYFSGRLYADDNSYGEFRLRHVDSPNWNDFYYGYDYDYYGPYYQKSIDGSTNESNDSKPVRIMRKQTAND